MFFSRINILSLICYRYSRFHYVHYKTSLILNSFYCYQDLRYDCDPGKTDNIEGEIYFFRNKSIGFLNGDQRLFSNLNNSCVNEGAKHFQGNLHVKSKYLPVQKICVNKKQSAPTDPSSKYLLMNLHCFSYLDFLFSTNSIITDSDIHTCSDNIKFETVNLKKVKKSSLIATLWMSYRHSIPQCKAMNVYSAEKERCGASSMKNCFFIESKLSEIFHLKYCRYECSDGEIEQLFLEKNSLEWESDMKLCEIEIQLLDTSYFENSSD